MNLMDLFIKIGVDDQASGKMEEISSGMIAKGQLIADAISSAVQFAGEKILDLGKQAIEGYADYEQLVGGVETLFKKSSPKVQKYASEAYKTAGLSANEYMETVTSFSASLLQSLEQDTEAAAEYADVAIRDMSDNANKMGTDIAMIQNAYQGFAKQNFTMLDNLKLGYGGTKTEMERLIADANAVKEANGEMADLSIDKFADIVEAIHIVQTEMGITGTTAKEAGATISGSTASMKAAYENLVAGLADENADIGKLFDDLVVSIVGDGSDANKGALGNLLPRIEQVFKGIGTVADVARPYIEEGAVKVLDYFGVKMADGEQINASLFEGANGIVSGLATLLTQTDALDKLSEGAVGILTGLTEKLTDSDSLEILGKGAADIITELGGFIATTAPGIISGATNILTELMNGFFTEENINAFSEGAVNIIKTLGNEIIEHKDEIASGANKLAEAISGVLKGFDWPSVGYAIGDTVVSAIGSVLESTLTAVGSLIGSVGTGGLLGIYEAFGIEPPQGLVDEYNEMSDFVENSPGLQLLEGIGKGLGVIEEGGTYRPSYTTGVRWGQNATVADRINVYKDLYPDLYSQYLYTTDSDTVGFDASGFMEAVQININIDGETAASALYDPLTGLIQQKGAGPRK